MPMPAVLVLVLRQHFGGVGQTVLVFFFGVHNGPMGMRAPVACISQGIRCSVMPAL